MPSTEPSISMVMPVYNAEAFLPAAIDSILAQTFTDFEFIIVDDASTDRTPEIVAHYQTQDARIQVVQQTSNQGITAALNRGCRMARGRYIARMDADDLSLPQRLAKQFAFLEQHPEVGVVGCWIQRIDARGKDSQQMRYPTSSGLIKWTLLFYSPLAHPSVLMRTDILKQVNYYDAAYPKAQDYELWARLVHITHMANLPEVLYLYREWAGSATGASRPLQDSLAQGVTRQLVTELLGHETPDEQISALQGLSAGRYPTNTAQIQAIAHLLQDLQQVVPATFQLAPQDTRQVRLDGAIKVWLLAALALRRSPGLALRLAWRATRLHSLSGLAFGAKALTRLIARLR